MNIPIRMWLWEVLQMPKPEAGREKICNVLWALDAGYIGVDVAYGLKVSEALVSRIKNGDPKIMERYLDLRPIQPDSFRLRCGAEKRKNARRPLERGSHSFGWAVPTTLREKEEKN
jgi:hypothetical protein